MLRASRFVAPVFSPARRVRFALGWGLQIVLAFAVLATAAFGFQQAAGQARFDSRPQLATTKTYTLPEVVVTAKRRRGAPAPARGASPARLGGFQENSW